MPRNPASLHGKFSPLGQFPQTIPSSLKIPQENFLRTIPPEKFSFASFHCKKTVISYRFSNYVGYPPPWIILPENLPTLSEKLFPQNIPPWRIYPAEIPPPPFKTPSDNPNSTENLPRNIST